MLSAWWLPAISMELFGIFLALVSLILRRVYTKPFRDRFWDFNIALGLVITFFGTGILGLGIYAQLS